MPKLSDFYNKKDKESRDELKEILNRMLIYARSLTGNLNDAQELLQNAIVKALDREDKFDGKFLKAWLRTIILNTFRDNLRKYNPVIPNNGDFDAGVDTSVSLETEIILTDLEKCLENFTERDREIFYLVGDRYTSEEIAEDMNMTPGNVRQILSRKRPELDICLQGEAA
tara:strand:- start:524 stop:1033 length:510 start_codon:yes stop_codon:yes gene_type:complete